MSIENNKVIDHRVMEEIWSRGNLALVNELVADNSVFRPQGLPEVLGVEGYKQYVSAYRKAFPDLNFTFEDQIAENDVVISRWTATGTHLGDLMGIPPTGKSGKITGINITRYANGKLVEGWNNWDALGLLQQLGIIPAPGQ